MTYLSFYNYIYFFLNYIYNMLQKLAQMLDLGELVRRAVKYLVEGVMVALAAFAIQKYLDPGIKQRVQYTTTSTLLQKRLGIATSKP